MSTIHVKRQPDKRKTYAEKRKKLRRSWYREKKSITYIEGIPNELFYEIFDYLDGCDIYQSFSNLNLRFQHILSSSNLQLKINLLPFLDKDTQHDCMNIISQQRHQIISLRLMYTSNIDRFLTLITFDSSFSRLESLVFAGIKPDNLLQHLSVLASLPRLISLILCIDYNLKFFRDIYNLIFNLPILKYMKLSSEAYEPFIPLTIATNDQFSSIEYLIINHSCCLNDLVSILSYTPRLNRLTCRELLRSNENIIQEATINLSNLTHICISECYVVFDILELFIKKISSQLQVLRITTYWDASYLHADRWERLISAYMPFLREFCYQHHDFIDDDFEVTEYHTLINRFISSFWITRQHIFELAIDVNDWSWSEIIYSIYPYKRKWYELQEMTEIDVNYTEHHISTNDYSQDIELTITAPFFGECKELFTDNTISLFALLRITRLDLPYSEIFVGTLIDLIHHLPNLDSLRIWSLSLLKFSCVSDEQTSTLCLLSNKNKITKINIQCLTELPQLQFLIDFCPNMQYLEIGCLNDINPKSFIRFILTKHFNSISQLCFLCFCIATLNDKIVKDIQNMIDSEKLCHDYTIKHLCNKIYLQWE